MLRSSRGSFYHGAASAATRAATSCGAPSAGTSRQRAGNSAASARNPSRSRAWNAAPKRSKRSSLAAAGGAAGGRERRVEVEDQRQVRLDPDRERMQRVHHAAQVRPRHPLVDAGRIREAVAEHGVAAGERRADQPLEMVAAGGGEEQDLGLRRPAAGGAAHHELADRLRPRGAAGLARLHHAGAGGAQAGGQRAQLRGLARPVDALEADEAPAPPCPSVAPGQEADAPGRGSAAPRR